jgi:hypothetical protein
LIDRPDKLPTLDFTVGIGGRKSGSWRASMSLVTSGAASTAPDMDPFLRAGFGKAPIIVASTSARYEPDDLSPTLSIWNFRKPANAKQQVAFGSTVNQIIVRGGGNVPTIEFNGESYWVLDSAQFATAETAAKGGLTAFPAEPATPVTSGDIFPGYKGLITLDGNTYGTLRTFTITYNFGRELEKEVFNSDYPDPNPAQDRRDFRIEFELKEDDTANLKSLMNKAITNTPVDLTFTLGTVAGNIVECGLNNVVLVAPRHNANGRSYGVAFTGKAHSTSASSKDPGYLLFR